VKIFVGLAAFREGLCGNTLRELFAQAKYVPPHAPTSQHSTAQHSTAQHSTAQHSTAQHSTAQHSTAQHSTAPQHITTAQRITGASLTIFSPPRYPDRVFAGVVQQKLETDPDCLADYCEVVPDCRRDQVHTASLLSFLSCISPVASPLLFLVLLFFPLTLLHFLFSSTTLS
jgi:hypothetical protein